MRICQLHASLSGASNTHMDDAAAAAAAAAMTRGEIILTLPDTCMQVSVKFRGRTFKGVVNAEPEEPLGPATRSSFRQLNSVYMDAAAGDYSMPPML